jgi:hypothetical protein
MSFDLSAFKVLIKKIFPPKKSVYTVDTQGDGEADSIQIKALNIVFPFDIPEDISFGDFELEDLENAKYDVSEHINIYLDGESINLSKVREDFEEVSSRFIVYHKGEEFTFKDLMAGKMAGRTIAMGDTITILVKLDKRDLERLELGKHTLKIDSEAFPSLKFNFELTEDNTDIRFNPSDT